jgi:hypothetical protein
MTRLNRIAPDPAQSRTIDLNVLEAFACLPDPEGTNVQFNLF